MKTVRSVGRQMLTSQRHIIATALASLFLLCHTIILGNLGASLLAQTSNAPPQPIPRIAHAGGAITGKTYTNSLVALDANANHYRLFEIDLNFTSDGHLACIHDWSSYPGGRSPDLAGFLRSQKGSPYPKCTLDSLIGWLNHHPDARIVTDVKDDNIHALSFIAEHYPHYVDRFVPQIYFPHEYASVHALGYRDIIWTLYRYRWGGAFVLYHLRSMKLYAVTMPTSPRRAQFLPPLLTRMGIASYVHTINDPTQLKTLQQNGVSEIYTDTLLEH